MCMRLGGFELVIPDPPWVFVHTHSLLPPKAEVKAHDIGELISSKLAQLPSVRFAHIAPCDFLHRQDLHADMDCGLLVYGQTTKHNPR